MRVPVQTRRIRLQMNMTPMIDVVFLLIIFFLVSSHLAKQEVQAELALPTAETGKDRQQTTTARVTINVVPEGGEYTVKLGALPVRPTELAERLGHELAAHDSDLEIRVRADQTTPYRVIEPILLTCARQGIWNVKFAVVRRDVRSTR